MSTQRDELLDTVRIEVFEAVVSISDGYHPRSEDDHAIIHKAAETIMSAIAPRMVVNFADLEALPHEAVIRDAMGDVYEKWSPPDESKTEWMTPGTSWTPTPALPATVLFTPEATA